jgi:hypothetical protein
MDRHAVQRWLDGHRAAERRELERRRSEGAPPAAVSFAAAMELLELADMTAGGPEDPVRARELAATRSLWARLKQPWAAKHVSG